MSANYPRLQVFLTALKRSNGPEDVFGPDPILVHDNFVTMIRECHEDLFDGQYKETAREASKLLGQFWAQAKEAIATGRYGKPPLPKLVVTFKADTFTATRQIGSGDKSTVWRAVNKDGKPVILKVARSHDVNDLFQREAEVAKRVKEACANTALMCRYYQDFVWSGSIKDDATKSERQVIVYGDQPELISFERLMDMFPNGVYGQHLVWIGNRIWVALGYMHDQNIIHGAVLPPHLLASTAEHGVMLIDWAASPHGNAPLSVVSPSYEAWYPPEVWDKRHSGSSLDLYMAAKCLKALAPDNLDKRLDRILDACLLANPARRTQDAWGIYDRWRDAAQEVYGKPVFVPFSA